MSQATYAAAAALGVPLLAYSWSKLQSEDHPPFPPGPKPEFLIGNARQFPQDRWHEKFTEWQKAYGDLVYTNVLGNDIIVINSLDIAKELLVKRGNIYSGRARIPIIEEVMEWDWSLVMVQPGQFHSEGRVIFKKAMGEREVAQFDHIIHEERDLFIENLKNVQGDPMEIIRESVGATVIKVAYGGSIFQAHGADLIKLNREMIDIVAPAPTQFWLVNYIPSLHYLPNWLPLPFKKLGASGSRVAKRLRSWAWDETVKHFNEGIAEHSIASQYLDKGEKLDTVRDTLALLYGAGVDNTVSTTFTFIATMLQHPETQKKIQEELDAVLEGDTLPAFADRAKLRYMDAAWRESIRLHPTAIVGVPHRADQDDIYGSMFIPKGSMLITNVGFMFHDPRVFDEPDVYRPERWLAEHNPSADSLPDTDWVFGFGRRVCPGQFLADRMGFVFAASLLKAYTIAPLPGEVIPKEFSFHDAIIRYPENVRCRFVSR